uniref:UDP-glucuronosyltransferase n=1 Tax=Xylotrechus quadripes TaxID=554073 RepID=A0A6G7SEN8_9CUCU|nr:UDP-glycosyltransferase [Xylotrechus quadripes]
MISVFFLCLLVGFDSALCANILMVYELPSPSHQLWDYSLAEGLMAKGHNVTMLGPFADRGKKSDKYHPIVIEGILETLSQHRDFDLEENLPNLTPLKYMGVYSDYCIIVCNHTYHSNGLKTLLNYPKDFKFDLIILDATLTTCTYPLIQRFGYPPTVGMTALLLPSALSFSFGNVLQPSYLPIFVAEYTENMSFFQRVLNYVYTHLEIFNKKYFERWHLEKIVKNALGEGVDPMEVLERHVSLLLCNLNPAVGYPQPLTPNIIPVGGLNVKPAKELPPDLKSIMDDAKDGVILFSLGTNIRSANLKTEVRKNLLEAFSRLKQIVLWKFEDTLDTLPSNVIIRKWLPQNDILGHPNTRLFISHGGALSTFEAIYHAVPIIGMPFFLDQKVNINSLVEKNMALKIDPSNFNSDELFQSIIEILNNPMYGKNFKEYSRRMKDQPQQPLERAVFWAEYAMRHDGAHFLNPMSRDMPIFVSSSTDVILFLTSVCVTFITLLYVTFKKIGTCLVFKSPKKQKIN